MIMSNTDEIGLTVESFIGCGHWGEDYVSGSYIPPALI